MASVVVDVTTAGADSHVVDSGVTGDVTIETWGSGAGGYAGEDYGGYGGGGGGYAKGVFTITGGTQLDYSVAAGGASSTSGDSGAVLDNATAGSDVIVSADGGGIPGGGSGFAAGALLVGASDVVHSGGSGYSPSETSVGGGGGSSGCPTADGNSASDDSGAASAGTGSGAGGDGGTASAGSSGSSPGGGGGGGATGESGGTGADGRIRISYETADASPPAITSSSTANVEEGDTAVLTVTATGDPTPTFSITGGVDAALFSINSSSGALTFDVAPDYEVPTDDDEDNVYVVQVTATNIEGTDDQVISVTVTNDPGDDPSTGRKKYIVALMGIFD